MPEAISIRPITTSDVPSIAHWVAATPLWQRYKVTESSFAERLNAGLADNAAIYVARRDSQAVGFVWLVERGAFARSAYVQLIGVRQDARSDGIGRALMEFAEAKGNSPDMFLLVSDFNLEAQRFYARLGYRQVGKLDDYVVQGVGEVIFWKRLK